jgi:hypothetical protein
MANDITAAPELYTFRGRLFSLSPLNEYEESCLEAWLRWRCEKNVELYSELAANELQTIAGATQLLHQSIRRTEPNETVISLFEFISGDLDTVLEIYTAWLQVNSFDDIKLPATPAANDSKQSEETTKEYIYYVLSESFGWHPDQIKLLTRVQKFKYVSRALDTDKSPDGKKRFATEDEYHQYMANKRNAK